MATTQTSPLSSQVYSNCLPIECALPGEAALLSRIRAHDWSRSDLGQPSSWPEALHGTLALCAASRVPMVLCWGPSAILFYNDAFAAVSGRTRLGGAFGRALREAWPDLAALIAPLMEQVRTSGRAADSPDLSWSCNRVTGREDIYLRFSCSPVFEDERVAGVLGICQDTTETRLADRRLATILQLSSRFARAHADDADAVARIARDVLADNPHDLSFAALYLVEGDSNEARLSATTGLPANHLLPASIGRASHELSLWPIGRVIDNRCPQVVVAAISNTEPPSHTLLLPCFGPASDACAGVLVVGLHASCALDPAYRAFLEQLSDRIGSALGAVSARARAEALMVARDAAQQANEAKSRFLTAASHDLRQPLQSILLLESVLSRTLRDSDLAPDVQLLGEAARSMDELLAALLDINRLEGGAIVPELREFSLHQLLGQLRAELAPVAASKSLSLAIVDSHELVRSDPTLLHLILRNLLGSALKHLPQGCVTLRVRPRDELLQIDVSDGGLRFPPGPLERALEAWNPGRDTRRGAGLALAIVQRISQLLKHEVRVEAPEGGGSTFSLRLPRVVPPEREQAKAPTTARPAAPDRAGSALTLLHIEDDPAISRLLASILRFQGYRVVSATSREEALHRIDAQGVRPDLIVTDYLLPAQTTGDEVVAEIAARLGSRPPTILLTGDLSPELRQRAERKVDRILAKPVEIELLLHELAALSPKQ